MKASIIFSCWATLPSGELRRLELTADGHAAAVAAGFARLPRATAVSCRATGAAEERRHA